MQKLQKYMMLLLACSGGAVALPTVQSATVFDQITPTDLLRILEDNPRTHILRPQIQGDHLNMGTVYWSLSQCVPVCKQLLAYSTWTTQNTDKLVDNINTFNYSYRSARAWNEGSKVTLFTPLSLSSGVTEYTIVDHALNVVKEREELMNLLK